MNGVVAAVRKNVDKSRLVKRCRREGCAVSLAEAPESRLIVDFDKPASPLGSDSTRCDYLFVAEESGGSGWVAPLELKKGQLHAGEVVRQLQAGARAAECLVPPGIPVAFRPVAVSGNVPKAERDRLRNKSSRIRFHGRGEPVRLIPCGARLVQALRP